MACSQDSDFKNDLEVKNTLSRNFDDILQGSESKPLSPILGRGSLDRKFLIGRRIRNRKSRVKLSDRFKENEERPSSATPLRQEIQYFSEDSFTVSQDMDKVKQIEKLEEIENKRNKIYSMLNVGEKNEFCFKKPGSPLLNKAKKPKICDENEDVINNEPSIENVEHIYRLSEHPHVAALPSSGFQTATGKSIKVSDVDIKRHSKLFDDIISESNEKYNLRENKYAFLRKSKSSVCVNTGVLKFDIKLALSDSDLSNHKSSKTALNTEQTKFNPYIVLEGTQTELEAVDNRQVNEGTLRSDKHISLTQEICESGVSNSQMLLAVDEALNSVQNDKHELDQNFRGFDKEEVAAYENIFQRFVNICQILQSSQRKINKRSIFSITKQFQRNIGDIVGSGKRITDDLPLPPTKRIRNLHSLENVEDSLPLNVENKENQLLFNENLGADRFPNISGNNMKTSNNKLPNKNSICDNMNPALFKKELTAMESTSISEFKTVLNSNSTEFGGFRSASGKHIAVSDNSMKRAKNIFDDIDSDLPKGNLNLLTNQGFSSASGKHIMISDSSLNKAKTMFNDIDSGLPIKNVSKDKAVYLENITLDMPNKVAYQGFSSASGKQITISDSDLNKAKAMFDDIDSGFPTRDLSEGKHKSLISDSVASNSIVENFPNTSGKSIEVSQKNVSGQSDSNLFKKNRSKTGVISTSRSYQKVTRSKLEILETIPEHVENDDSSSVKNNESSTSRVKNIFADFDLRDIQPIHNTTSPLKPCFKITKHDSLKVLNLGKTHDIKNVSKSETKPRKRLGISSCKLLQVSDDKLEKAKLLFDEDFSKISPMRPMQCNVYASTPLRQNSCVTPSSVDLRPLKSVGEVTCSTPIRRDVQKPSRSFSSFIEGAGITPIKPNATDDRKDNFLGTSEQSVVLASPTKGTIVDWLSKLRDDREKLEGRLRIILERQRLMERLNREKSQEEKRPREGILHHRKATSNRISLEFFVDNKKPGEESMNYDLFDITPENAEYVHFKDQYSASVTTEDGAIVIPNLHDVIGVSEIETAFMAMSGVDPRLVPKGWIGNHYKWIVWKLTSYARMFPVKFGSCLNIENVVQQLKYRYDREVDRAERSALRKIYEKDDVPQKRLVLCVSSVKEMTTSGYELELTDGWYSIRTVIDEPLKNQIRKQKIRVGTKLLISGAELFHCDGCYPLEATSLTCLKIGFNCTRRVHWNTRLGYQRSPEHFPIPIQCVHPLGGPIGAIKVCVVRVYPLKYLEKSDGRSVWRNKKAEERRAQQWENERCKKLEAIQEDLAREFEDPHRRQNLHSSKRHCSSGVSSPRTLCEILENSDDPESVQKNLTYSQQAAILDYQDNLNLRKQLEVAERIREDVHKLKLSRRDVVAVLKLLVVDISSSPDRGFSFFVWKPGESHMQMLREGTIVTFQNVLPKRNGDLNSYSKTIFRPESPAPHLYSVFKRRVTHIAELTHSNFSPTFNEFDTVGLVVHVKVEVSCQDVWLTDRSGRLLLVHVYEGPSTCLLLDSLKRGQATTICNLIYRGVTGDVSRAFANHFTVFSCYSQHRHLQEGLDEFLKQLPEDVDALLKDCDTRIEMFRMKTSYIRNDFSTTFEDEDESTMVSSRLTSTDVALSLIDMDKFT